MRSVSSIVALESVLWRVAACGMVDRFFFVSFVIWATFICGDGQTKLEGVA